jgi:hypothetical protein
MLGIKDLKPAITVTDTSVECPVLNCSVVVVRRRKGDKQSDRFHCPQHGIYISPTRFEYECESNNLLWHDEDDAALLRAVKTVKRECRLTHNTSEDAVTWNVFRYLEKSDRVAKMISYLCERSVVNPKLVYWSYSRPDCGVWPPLAQVRAIFGERPQSSTEPDVIIVSEDTLYWIEAKFSADNGTRSESPTAKRHYLMDGNAWFTQVFKCDYDEIARNQSHYELMRLWLLGTWVAKSMKPIRRFVLLNLVCEGQEEDIEDRVASLLAQSPDRHFWRATWEDIGQYITANCPRNLEREVVLDFFRNKALKYDHRGRLQPGFRWNASWLSETNPGNDA